MVAGQSAIDQLAPANGYFKMDFTTGGWELLLEVNFSNGFDCICFI